LQDGVLDEVDAVDYIGIPCPLGEIREETEELDEDADAGSLYTTLVGEALSGLQQSRYRYGYKDSNHYARQHGQCCLLVVLAGEQAGILECSQGANYGELGAPEDGIRLKVAHLAMCVCF